MDKNEIFTLWVADEEENELPLLAYMSLKSMILCKHDVILYTYSHILNVPSGVQVLDANKIINKNKIFKYKQGHKTYSGFSNLFRLKRLYEYGGTWLDLDTILIKNINTELNNDIIICSEHSKKMYLHPNNALLRFPKHDPLIKSMLNFAEKKGQNIKHGETGPRLVANMLKTSFPEYNYYLKHFNFNNILSWNDIQDYSKSTSQLLCNINPSEIIGFHLFNTFFKKIIDSIKTGFFYLLKLSVLYSNSPEEYQFYLNKYGISKLKKIEKSENWDLKYLSVIKNSLDKYNKPKFTLLINAKKLKKIEIYNILHSIRYQSSFDIQVILFGRTDIPNDKIELNKNFIIFISDFNKINQNIREYILGEYIIPIDKPIIFMLDFFKNKIINSDIEQHITNKKSTKINILSKKSFKILTYTNQIDIFNLSENILKNSDLKIDIKKEENIFDYGNETKETNNLIRLIDSINEKNISFRDVKFHLESIELNNLIDEVSYYYYTAYENIMNSDSYKEYILNEEKTDLNCLISFYLNEITNN